ncbi:COX15/CtaA family protein [Chromatiaceae bacterium AAb-1]|nr:COX15/CtaA family protein [Chromatiaceae bacterium AAb-1]
MNSEYTLMRRLVSAAFVLTLCVILLGAYTRLTDAGLGCPDWPGCYGFLKVPQKAESIAHAMAVFPERPLEPHKAWNEMVHRYFAGALGLLIAAIFLYSLAKKGRPRLLPALLLVLVVFQALLGMWTVTLNLMPLVVMGHLLGGFALLSLLALLWLQLSPRLRLHDVALRRLKPLAWLAGVVLLLQIALGGWTAANYAALACIELPVCEAGWQSRLNISEAFDLHLGHDDYEYGVMSADARQTVHVFHRLGAVITLLVLGGLLCCLWRYGRERNTRLLTMLLTVLLLVQFSLGVLNVVLHLPLFNAVAHNVVAANLLMAMAVLLYQLQQLKTKEVPYGSVSQ